MNWLYLAAGAFHLAKSQAKINDINESLNNVIFATKRNKESIVFEKACKQILGEEETKAFRVKLKSAIKIFEEIELGHYSGMARNLDILKSIEEDMEYILETHETIDERSEDFPPISRQIIDMVNYDIYKMVQWYAEVVSHEETKRKNNVMSWWIFGIMLLAGFIVLMVFLNL